MPYLCSSFRACCQASILICGLAVVVACNSSDEATARAISTAAESTLSPQLSGGGSSTLSSFIESGDVLGIAASFPTPELPSAEEPFRTQPNQRFEQWSLSSMTQNEVTGDWLWTEQQFFRIAVAPATENSDENPSAWSFRDVMAQQYTTYNFSSKHGQSSSSAERRAMQLSDVTEDSVFVNDKVVWINSNGCESTLSLDRTDTSLTWTTSECPTRIQLDKTIISSTNSEFEDGVGWVFHAYGQIPAAAGAVFIDRLEVRLPDKTKLSVNRSRRRSGTGPVTVAASLSSNGKTQSLRDVKWMERLDGDALFPSGIRIEAPELSLVLDVEMPSTLPSGALGTDFGVQHGVLITIDNTVLPGLISLQPRIQEAS